MVFEISIPFIITNFVILLNQNNLKPSMNLLAMAVGIKQKQVVNQIVEKVIRVLHTAFCLWTLWLKSIFILQFLSSNFVVMLFHYDGVVDDWRDLSWSDRIMHVSGVNQTKW